jgi:hypothetical protein
MNGLITWKGLVWNQRMPLFQMSSKLMSGGDEGRGDELLTAAMMPERNSWRGGEMSNLPLTDGSCEGRITISREGCSVEKISSKQPITSSTSAAHYYLRNHPHQHELRTLTAPDGTTYQRWQV